MIISSSFTLHVNDTGLLTCPIWISNWEAMPVQTLVVPGATPMLLLYQGAILGQRSIQITISPSSHL